MNIDLLSQVKITPANKNYSTLYTYGQIHACLQSAICMALLDYTYVCICDSYMYPEEFFLPNPSHDKSLICHIREYCKAVNHLLGLENWHCWSTRLWGLSSNGQALICSMLLYSISFIFLKTAYKEVFFYQITSSKHGTFLFNFQSYCLKQAAAKCTLHCRGPLVHIVKI